MKTIHSSRSTPTLKQPHDYLFKDVTVCEPGFAYVYLSNENESMVEVYYDEFTVDLKKSPVINNTDLYPYGAPALSYQRENSLKQDKLLNGKEWQDELGYKTFDLGQRDIDPFVPVFPTIDRFAEKYYSMSPYQYNAGNPVLHIDVNGDSIVINHKKDRIVYNNGKLTYMGTNKAYQGKVDKKGQLKGFVGKTVRALDQVRTGGTAGKGLVDDLQNDSRYVQISQGKENSTTGIKVKWDPSNTSGGLDTQGSTKRPAFIGLAHELAHANDLLQDGKIDASTWFTTTDGQAITNAEKYATHIENQIRSENGLNLREYYTQIPYAPARITIGNTSLHIQRKVNLTPIKIGGRFPVTITPSVYLPYKY